MGIKWNLVKHDLLELAFNISKMIVAVVFVFTMPIGVPLTGFIYLLQDRYSTNEVNKYVALYLGVTFYIFALMIEEEVKA